MRILFIVPGSGDSFYCGNCFRDNLHAQALRKAGHDVVIMPLYLPLTDDSFRGDTPLFFPATSYYVAHEYFKKKKMPRLVEKVLNSDAMMGLASSFSGTTSAKGMEGITLSMIKGDDTVFAEQANKLVGWIVNHEKPDVIHLSSSMLIGIAKMIKKSINLPIVCSLQDEEVWLDSLDNTYAKEAWEGIANNIGYIDRFVASSEFYKSVALSRVPTIKEIDVVYPGLDISKYASDDFPEDPTIGFFYRLNFENGLDIVAEAFVKLKRENRIPNLKLKIGGGYTRENKKFVHQIREILAPYLADVHWAEDYNLNKHTEFYKDISLICVPIRFDEAVGLYICEAFAAGRPAVEPDTGSFGEIIGEGGILYSPNDSDRLADAIENILVDESVYNRCKVGAMKMSNVRYNNVVVVEKLISIYTLLIN